MTSVKNAKRQLDGILFFLNIVLLRGPNLGFIENKVTSADSLGWGPNISPKLAAVDHCVATHKPTTCFTLLLIIYTERMR